jgi:putative GTP pyrophosphokinase
MLSHNIIYVKVEVQIRTMAMDYWASIEHKMKYKSKIKLNKKDSKEWVSCAKMINKLDYKMTLMT